MLDFWYSERCHRQIKLTVCIVLCLLIYCTAKVAELSSFFIVCSLALGIFVHLLKVLEQKIPANQRYKTWLDVAFFIVPLLIWLLIMFNLPTLHLWALMLQVLGFSALGLLVISLYSLRAKR